jgi:hypothetical protein
MKYIKLDIMFKTWVSYVLEKLKFVYSDKIFDIDIKFYID